MKLKSKRSKKDVVAIVTRQIGEVDDGKFKTFGTGWNVCSIMGQKGMVSFESFITLKSGAVWRAEHKFYVGCPPSAEFILTEWERQFSPFVKTVKS